MKHSESFRPRKGSDNTPPVANCKAVLIAKGFPIGADGYFDPRYIN